MERNALVFDIADPCDALNFAVFLFRLSRIYAPKLKRRVEEAREKILRNGGKIPEWTQEHQHPTPPREKRFEGQGAEIDLTDEDEDEDDTEVAEVAGEVAGESTQEDEDSEDSKEVTCAWRSLIELGGADYALGLRLCCRGCCLQGTNLS